MYINILKKKSNFKNMYEKFSKFSLLLSRETFDSSEYLDEVNEGRFNTIFDQLYRAHESAHHFKSIIADVEKNIKLREQDYLTNSDFLTTAVATVSMMENIEALCSLFGVAASSFIDFKSEIINSFYKPSKAFYMIGGYDNYNEITLCKALEEGMVIDSENLNEGNYTWYVVKHIRNKMIHPNSRKAGHVHISGNSIFGGKRIGDAYLFGSSLDSHKSEKTINFLVSKDFFVSLWEKMINVFAEVLRKLSDNQKRKKLTRRVLWFQKNDFFFRQLEGTHLATLYKAIDFVSSIKESEVLEYISYVIFHKKNRLYLDIDEITFSGMNSYNLNDINFPSNYTDGSHAYFLEKYRSNSGWSDEDKMNHFHRQDEFINKNLAEIDGASSLPPSVKLCIFSIENLGVADSIKNDLKIYKTVLEKYIIKGEE